MEFSEARVCARKGEIRRTVSREVRGRDNVPARTRRCKSRSFHASTTCDIGNGYSPWWGEGGEEGGGEVGEKGKRKETIMKGLPD